VLIRLGNLHAICCNFGTVKKSNCNNGKNGNWAKSSPALYIFIVKGCRSCVEEDDITLNNIKLYTSWHSSSCKSIIPRKMQITQSIVDWNLLDITALYGSHTFSHMIVFSVNFSQ